MKIDFESSLIKFKNDNKFEIRFEIKNTLNFNSDAGKSNKELCLVSRLYIAISI
jgi:hypothetical protein